MHTRHLLAATYSGLAFILIAALASAVRVTLDPAAASLSLLVTWGGVNLVAWGWSAVRLPRESLSGFGQLLLALGDLLLPLNLYMVGMTSVKPIVGSVPLSASCAAMIALVYYLFADLAMRRIPLTCYAHRAYLFTACSAIAIYFTHFTVGVPFTAIALLLVGLAGLLTALDRLLDRPLRGHYAVAAMLLIFALLGLFARSFVQQADGVPLLGIYPAAGFLFILSWLNRATWISKLLGLAAWMVLTLALAASLSLLLETWQPAHLMFAALWVVLLVSFWGLVDWESARRLKESAYWLALAVAVIVAGSLWPLWRGLAALYLAGLLEHRFAAASSLSAALPPGSRWSALGLALIVIAWGGSVIIRHMERATKGDERRGIAWVDGLIGAVPLLLLLVVISAAAAEVFGAVSWVVALLAVTGMGYRWAGAQLDEGPELHPPYYPAQPFTILGYVGLGLAVVTACYNLLAALVTLAVVALFLLFVSRWYDSLAAAVLGLIHLLGLFLLVSFGLFPQRPALALAWLYLLLVIWVSWRSLRLRQAKAPARVPVKTLMAWALIILLAAFVMAASLFLRQFHPLTFLIIALGFIPIRYVWESAWPTPADRSRRGLCLLGSSLAHVAVGFLLYSLLLKFRIPLATYGVAFAGLSTLYLAGVHASSGDRRPVSRASLVPFVHMFSLLAVVLTVMYCPSGVRAVLAWLLVLAVHVSLSAHKETQWVYPVRGVKALSLVAISLAAVNLLWRGVPALAAAIPLPQALRREPSLLLTVSALLALGLIFSILMNREQSLIEGLLALGFIVTALGLVAFVAAPGSVSLICGLLYVYLLVVSRVTLRRTNEEAFSHRLPWINLWLASGLLLLLMGVSALRDQWNLPSLVIVTGGFLAFSPGWEQALPAYVQRRLRLVLLSSYVLGHVAAAVTVVMLLRAFGVALSHYGLAFAALAGLHLLGYWLTRRRPAARLREKLLWHFSHYLAVTSVVLIIGLASRSTAGALAALLLALMCQDARWLSGRLVYQHLGAYFLVAATAIIGRAWNINLLEFYLIPLATYLGWVLYRGTENGAWLWASSSPGRLVVGRRAGAFIRFGLTIALLLMLVVYPGWRFAVTGGLVHLCLSGLGAVAAAHVFALTRAHSWLTYLIGLVLILEAGSIGVAGHVKSLDMASLIIIGSGLLLMADLGHLARRRGVRDE